MITVSEATDIIFAHLFKSAPVSVPLTAALGRVLAESIYADRDFPPFDRVAMDGIAIRHDAWSGGRRSFAIEATQAAGEEQKNLKDPGNCLEVMTGAILPSGCDTVVRYEDVELSGGQALIKAEEITAGQNVHRRGADASGGQVLLTPTQMLSPAEIALLASVGKTEVSVFDFPRIAVVSSGDELVEVGTVPGPYQIRRSNTYALLAALRDMGAGAAAFHFEDNEAAMNEHIAAVAETHDVLILSGGVSKGKFDFVPAALEHAGIHKKFHQVSQRPGKPFWFGASSSGKIAFALPGNPVSTFMCFYRYIRPWLQRSLGLEDRRESATLAEDFFFQPRLTHFLQVRVAEKEGRRMAVPVPGGGSGDFANLKDVTGFLELPLEKAEFRAGEVLPYFSFRP